MLTSIDGKVTGRYLDREECQPFVQDYYRILDEFQTNNWICGRTTFEEIIGHTVLDVTEFEGQEVERVDYIANSQASSLAIALDPSGKLTWQQNTIGEGYAERSNDHIVTVLSENVTDAYLAYLQSIGVSYIFAGKTRELEIPLLLEKLHRYFHLEKFYLLGGGIINGFFAKAEVVDEISLLIAPLIEGNCQSKSLFEMSSAYEVQASYRLVEMKNLDSGALHLTYRKK